MGNEIMPTVELFEHILSQVYNRKFYNCSKFSVYIPLVSSCNLIYFKEIHWGVDTIKGALDCPVSEHIGGFWLWYLP